MNSFQRPGWLIHVVPAVLSVVAVLYLGTGPGDVGVTPQFKYGDKVGHFLAFAFVQMTHARAGLFLWEGASRKRVHWAAFLVAGIWGGLLEIWQGFLPHRTAELADFVADLGGSGAAALVALGLCSCLRGEEASS